MAWTPSPAALAAITACVVVAGAGAGILLQPTKERAVPAARGAGVNIAVVAPREPVPEPGSVMDVGDLADGYSHRGYPQPADDYAPPYADPGDDPRPRAEPEFAERPRDVGPAPAPRPERVERRESSRRWPFGFDQPRPDYAAERRERMARMEEQRRLDEADMTDRFEDRGDDPDWRDDRDPEAWPSDRDRRGRERQWYRSDGSRIPGPVGRD